MPHPTDKEFIYGYEAGLKAAGQPVAINAGQVAYDSSASYTDGTVGGELNDMNECCAEVTADVAQLKSHINDLATELYEIREPTENKCYVTNFNGNKYASGVYTSWENETTLKIWGTATSWVRFNLLMGNTELVAGSPSFSKLNLAAGTYTLKASDSLGVSYGTDWSSRTNWKSGETITIQNAVLVWLGVKTSSQSFGTAESPTYFSIEIYDGEQSIITSAIDVKARNAIGTTSYNSRLTHADFDYERPYNAFKGTTLTEGKKVEYYTGALSNSTEGYAVTDYIEIDPTQGYLCVNIYIVLSYETGTGIVTGGNRLWVHTNCAFYDENKNYVATTSDQSDSSKAIPKNAKYVRLTIANTAMLPYAVLFYGQYNGQRWVRYRNYRKEITEESVYAATGMESLKMVMFGDSITQGVTATNDGDISYVEFANDYLRSNIINVGLGGTRMSQGSPDTVGLASFASLCENITSDDATAWDDLDTYAAATHEDWVPHITALKAVDWDSVQAVGILYGANDWHNSVTVGTEYNEDPTKYDGACAYGLKLLLTKYPHLQVIIFTPFFRVAEDDNSDEPNSAGLNMDDYGESLKNVQTVFHCPVVDAGNGMGINRYTIYTYTSESDGTHPRKVIALERIGRFVAESIKRFIQPY